MVVDIWWIPAVYPCVPVDDPQVADTIALAVDCSGHEQAVLDACRVVRKRGEVVLVGVPWRRQSDLTAHQVLIEVFHRYVHLRSGWEWEIPHRAAEFRPHSIYGDFRTALRWLIALGGNLVGGPDPYAVEDAALEGTVLDSASRFITASWTSSSVRPGENASALSRISRVASCRLLAFSPSTIFLLSTRLENLISILPWPDRVARPFFENG